MTPPSDLSPSARLRTSPVVPSAAQAAPLQLAANLDWLYAALPVQDRCAAAAADGFTGVELLDPYGVAPSVWAHWLRAQGLTLVLHNTPRVAQGPGRLGWAAIPGAAAAFQADLARAFAVAEATGSRRIHVMAGDCTGLDPRHCRQTLQENLALALRRAEAEALVLTLEPLNRHDMPGYHYHQPHEVLAVVQAFDSPHLRLQFDYYHLVREGLDPMAELARAAGWIGHVQIAGAPARAEPDLAQDGLFAAVQGLPAAGYQGWIGCEYRPQATAAAGLGWCAPLRAAGLLSERYPAP